MGVCEALRGFHMGIEGIKALFATQRASKPNGGIHWVLPPPSNSLY